MLDAGCAAPVAVSITADDVKLENFHAIRGGTFAAVDVANRDNVTIKRVLTYSGFRLHATFFRSAGVSPAKTGQTEQPRWLRSQGALG